MEILHKRISQPQQTSVIRTGSVAQKGNFQSALNGKMEKTSPWIIDLGASDHMTGDPIYLINTTLVLVIFLLE